MKEISELFQGERKEFESKLFSVIEELEGKNQETLSEIKKESSLKEGEILSLEQKILDKINIDNVLRSVVQEVESKVESKLDTLGNGLNLNSLTKELDEKIKLLEEKKVDKGMNDKEKSAVKSNFSEISNKLNSLSKEINDLKRVKVKPTTFVDMDREIVVPKKVVPLKQEPTQMMNKLDIVEHKKVTPNEGINFPNNDFQVVKTNNILNKITTGKDNTLDVIGVESIPKKITVNKGG